MDGWNKWVDRKVFLRLRNNRVYSGKIINVDSTNLNIIFLTILDKFNKEITIVHSEILEIKEEA